MMRGVTGVTGKSPSRLLVNERMLLKSGAWLTHKGLGLWEVEVDGAHCAFYERLDFVEPDRPWNGRSRVFKAWRGPGGALLHFRLFKEALVEAEGAARAKAAVGRLTEMAEAR
jgi:hypothetical protein